MVRYFLLGLTLLVIAAADLTAEVTKTPTQYLILKAKAPVVVDGKLGEWDMARTPHVISVGDKNPLCQVVSNDHVNPYQGDADCSGRIAVAWDETYLYVAASMVDNHLVGVKPDSYGNQGPAPWFCDSVMVCLACFRQPLKSNTPFGPYPTLGLRYAPSGPNSRGTLVSGGDAVLNKRDLYWILTENSQWKVAETPVGYDVEAAIPWKDLNFTARPGERLFMSFLVPDVDPGRGLIQIGWGFSMDSVKEYPVFRLADREDLLATLTVALDEVPANAPCAVRVELDSRTGTAKLEGLRVVDVQGKTVWQEASPLEVPAGMTGTEVREIKAGVLSQPGQYTVQAVAAGGVLTSLPLRVVPAAAEPPVVKNLPGEIHHMGPDRIAHNAWAEHRVGFYKHNFVKGKEDYVPYLRRHLEPGLKSAAEAAIKSKSPYGMTQAQRCLAMYAITHDDQYIALGRDIVDYTIDSGNLGWFTVTALMMYRYLTWLKDPNSPWAPPNAEKRLRENLYKVAANPSSDLFNEWGTHNRVWHRYMLQKIARLVAEQDGKPVDKRIIEYTDYHDKLIGEVGDTDDASTGYHWVFFDAAIGIYFFTGDWDAFLANRGYQKALTRYAETVSPSGACAVYGSVSGWPEVGQAMWAYELMSALTKDGRYRWTAHRIAEYYYNHLDYRANQYHGPYDTAINNFAFGYLLADDSVAPKPPSPSSRLTWRHPMAPVSLERQKEHPGTWMWEMDGSKWIPDKAILSSGNDPQAMWGMIELLPMGGHTGELPGNIIALMVHDAALFAGQGYYENTPDFQNMLWIEDLDGLAADPRPLTTEVPIFVDDPAFTFLRIVTTPYQHLPVTWTRDVLFYKNGFMVVKDRARFDTTMKVRLGPCYYARNLGPESGPHWFNAYYDQIYYTGLGLGRGVQAIRNPAWDLLVYFSPRPDRKHTVLDRFLENPYRNSPIQLRQTWSGMVRAGQELTFTSVLLPHAPLINPSSLLQPPADSTEPQRLEIVRDEDNLTVIKAVSALDPANRDYRETWIMLNDTGKLAEAGRLASDGLVAIVGHGTDGKILNRAIVGGGVLRYQGADESAAARKLQPTPVVVPEALLK